MWNLFGVMVLHAPMVDLGGPPAFGIYVHWPRYQMYVV